MATRSLQEFSAPTTANIRTGQVNVFGDASFSQSLKNQISRAAQAPFQFPSPASPTMARSSPRGKQQSSAAKGASTGPTALPGSNKRKTPPPQPPLPEGASGATPPPPAKRNPALFQRTWPPGDEVRILEALATHRREHGGRLPTPAELFGALDGSLEKKGVGAKKLAIKQRSFKRRYDRDAKKAAPPADEHERRLYLLSRHVWGPVPAPRPPVPEIPTATQGKGAGAQASKDTAQAKSAAQASKDATQASKNAAQASKDAAQAKRADHQSGKEAVKPKAKTLDEMRNLYPYLVDEATILVEPAVLESLLPSLEDSDAQVLEKKIRKARKKLAKAITESARINNMEMPTVVLLTSGKLQPEKLRVENEGHLDKTDDMDLCSKQRLARVECEVVELRQAVIASQSQAKGTRCESAKSGLESIVAENQTPANILQKRIEAPNGLIDGTTVEVTSKRYCAVRHNVPPNNLKKQGVMLPPFNVLPAMPRKVLKKRPTPCRATCKGGLR